MEITTPRSGHQGHVNSDHLALVKAELLQGLSEEDIVTGLFGGHGGLPDGPGSQPGGQGP